MTLAEKCFLECCAARRREQQRFFSKKIRDSKKYFARKRYASDATLQPLGVNAIAAVEYRT